MIIISIGTRPQYIKIKPLYDYFVKNNVCNYIVDTNQHYSDNVSKNLIDDLSLKINCNLGIKSKNEIEFISKTMNSLFNLYSEILDKNKNLTVVVFGDTNSTLASSIVAKKMGLNLAHIESGIRCGDRSRPEELNRIVVDNLADVHFISREKDSKNVFNPIYVGDMEYAFLNGIESSFDDISYDGPILLTIHRQENMDVDKISYIFNYCSKINYPIIFPIHHRTNQFISKNNILVPTNIKVVEPLRYMSMIKTMRYCRGIISDSGGVSKTSPFFGKKCIIPLDKVEWTETIDLGYATNELNLKWFDDYKINRNMELYYVKDCCRIIEEKINE